MGLLKERRKIKFARFSTEEAVNNSNRMQPQFTTHDTSENDLQATDSINGPEEQNRYSQQSSLSSHMLILEESKEEDEEDCFEDREDSLVS